MLDRYVEDLKQQRMRLFSRRGMDGKLLICLCMKLKQMASRLMLIVELMMLKALQWPNCWQSKGIVIGKG